MTRALAIATHFSSVDIIDVDHSSAVTFTATASQVAGLPVRLHSTIANLYPGISRSDGDRSLIILKNFNSSNTATHTIITTGFVDTGYNVKVSIGGAVANPGITVTLSVYENTTGSKDAYLFLQDD